MIILKFLLILGLILMFVDLGARIAFWLLDKDYDRWALDKRTSSPGEILLIRIVGIPLRMLFAYFTWLGLSS